MPQELPPDFMALLARVTNKRAKIVIDHILQHGKVTTDDLEKLGYKHPPRAARDVRELGIPLETTRVQSPDGRLIAEYRFGDLSEIRAGKLTGRQVFPKQLKGSLIESGGSKCCVCLEAYESRYLQIDHRVPYEVAGESHGQGEEGSIYMLLCGSCNRAKSWSCEHCLNWKENRDVIVCRTCYWANPSDYRHIAMRPLRRLDLVWKDEEVRVYDALQKFAKNKRLSMPAYVKDILARQVRG